MSIPRRYRPWRYGAAALTVTLGLALPWSATAANAAASDGCEGGGFSLVLPGGAVRAPADDELRTTIAADELGERFLVRGRYVEFTVDAATFGVRDWTLTGAPNPLDITGEQRTAVFASKTPDHRGLTLDEDLELRMRDSRVVLEREGTDLAMKIQAKDCAQGGVFQMELEREDGTATVVTHTLAPEVFYFDNPRFRERIGSTVPFELEDGTVVEQEVSARVNFANDVSPEFVGRDSAQVAERLPQCVNAFGSHCGGVSMWLVASGGRMGQVMGEDAVEVSPSATDCVADCQARNEIRGRAVVLGFPFPVPAESRLMPRHP
jgi:hypothetical protein